MGECFDLQADDGSGTAAAHRTVTFIAVTVTSLLEINTTAINVNATKLVTITAIASINRVLGKCMVLRAVDRLGQ